MKSSSDLLRRAGLAFLALGAAATVFAFTFILNPNTGLPGKWPAGPIPLVIRLGETANLSDGSSFNTSARSAAEEWNAVLGSTQFAVDLTYPNGIATQQNGINEIVFASHAYGQTFPPGVAGVTIRDGRGNMAVEADITLNSALTWDSYRGAPRPAVEIRRVVLHELGHALGLGHPDQVGQSVIAIMNSRAGFNDVLHVDDVTGVQLLYGPPGVPANDAFASAITFSLYNAGVGTTTLNGVNTNATQEPGEPKHALDSGPGQAPNSGGRSVWWRWTAPTTGSVTVDTKGSYFDTGLAVYTGSSVPSLAAIASNDDIQAGVIQASLVTFTANSGTTYQIVVDGFNGGDGHGADSGGITLNVAYNTADGAAPGIARQPANLTVAAGGNATFSVLATGSEPLSYQWRFNSNPIAGATSASLSLPSVSSTQVGVYSVTVTNAAGSVTSTGANLNVVSQTAPPPPPSSGGGGGGGGAPSLWFCATLLALGAARFRR